MTIGESLRKNAPWLVSGFVSFTAVLAGYRYFTDQSLFQPQADLGVLIGFVLVAGFMIHGDLNAPPKGEAQ